MSAQRRLALLFLLALAGVVLALSLVAWSLAGAIGVAAWLLLAAALLAIGLTRARRLAAARRRPPSTNRCGCCDGDHTAPVRVV